MDSIERLDEVPSPALLFDVDRIERNLDRAVATVAGETARLRPHIKTHKCAEILALQLERGVDRVKCATLAEAELAARAGVPDVLLAYPLVGPNLARFRALTELYPEARLSAVVDAPEALAAAERAFTDAPLPLFVDLDCGMHRTGIAPGDGAFELVQRLAGSEHLRFAGLHAYDGHIHDASPEVRRERFAEAMAPVEAFLERVESAGIEVPLVVSGGSPTFPLHAARALASGRAWECSPGTVALWDAGYGPKYPDMPYEPAALLLTRVVSRPGEGRLCLDLGHKAVSAENPLADRVRLPSLPGAEFLSQSEEHLVVSAPDASAWPVGAALVGVPYHVCPTVALHQRAWLVRSGRATGETWEIPARDRRITV